VATVRPLSDSAVVRARTRLWLLLLLLTRRLLRRRGYYRVCGWARRLGDADRHRVADDTEIPVPVGDIYWNTLLEQEYEPDVAAALRRNLAPDVHFVDCGANIGYWSMTVRHHCASVVAVEASPRTYRRLQDNAALNGALDGADGDRVTLLNRAVWRTSGELLEIREHDVHHAAASVTGETIGFESETWSSSRVESISLGDLVERHLPADGSAVVIKLDVEGAENEAMDGLGETAASRPVLVVYEDHGGDPSCRVTRHLHELGYTTADLDTGETLTLDDVAARKTDPAVGYNFAAMSSSVSVSPVSRSAVV
jgi:FkbM family methyltransferase